MTCSASLATSRTDSTQLQRELHWASRRPSSSWPGEPSRCAGRRCIRTNPHGLRDEIPAGLRRENTKWYMLAQPKSGCDLCRNEQTGICLSNTSQSNSYNLVSRIWIHVSHAPTRPGNAYTGVICIVVVLAGSPAMADCQRASGAARDSSLATVLVSEIMLFLCCKRQRCRPTV